MNIIFFGKPGAGKGTHSAVVSEKLGIPTISTGDLIREILRSSDAERHEIRDELKRYTSAGKLVPDSIVVNLLKNRISAPDCKSGFILDGFPRNVAQAKVLDDMHIAIDKVIEIDTSDDVIISRMSGRRSCADCGRVYNLKTEMKPKVDGVCDACSGKLVQRDDDSEDTVRERLKVYEEQTFPLKDYYLSKGILVSVDGNRLREEVLGDIFKVVSKC